MASRSKLYEGVPAGAVFEASQRSIRVLEYKLKKEDTAALSIEAKSSRTKKTFGLGITLAMKEVGNATELTIKTSAGQITDWGEGDEVIDSILYHVDAVVEEIRADGRIAPVKAIVYGMGEVSQRSPTPAEASAPQAKKSSSGSWILRIVAVAGVLWIINTEDGGKILSSIIGSFGVEADIAQYDCDKVAELFRGENLQNLFGGTFKIISVTSLKQLSKTETMIVCTGQMDLSNGTRQEMRMTVENKDESSQILYRAEPI